MKHNFVSDTNNGLAIYKCTNCGFKTVKFSYETIDFLKNYDYYYPCAQVLMKNILK